MWEPSVGPFSAHSTSVHGSWDSCHAHAVPTRGPGGSTSSGQQQQCQMALAAKADQAGTPPDVLLTVQSRDFLTKCLHQAQLDPELVADVADACELQELSALELGSSTLNPAEAADSLFLLEAEARKLLDCCRRQCLRAGVLFGDNAQYEPRPEDEWQPIGSPAKQGGLLHN